MPYKLSLLDKSPVAPTETAPDALARTLHLAKQAEKWGYHRFWIAEHHNTVHLASPSPELVIAWIAGQTHRIRLGSGGVMLQHYSPYKVAENFNLLASIAPGRIDIGIGKAPGGLPLSTKALQHAIHPEAKGSFNEQVNLLNKWIKPAKQNDTHQDEYDNLLATPLPNIFADGYLLGASEETALFAAKLGWHFVFAAHLNGDKTLLENVTKAWKANSELPTIVAVQVIVAKSTDEAKRLAKEIQLWGVELENGQKVTVATEAQAHAFVRQSGQQARSIFLRESNLLAGTAEEVHAQLTDLQTQFGIDEFIVDTPIVDAIARLRSVLLLAQFETINAETSVA
ncbi:LLM class flavin-dependent oxidoreductase [Thorsellia anophelis]|uniref:LLM class flavin-dependent oxidoreductase n=1 Tax=Thorsellia anophelis TaxID=336804 RepID=UPI000B83338D|nr:LLM class flavin-dependent oxidoreductase [Thorsellia anophelis]